MCFSVFFDNESSIIRDTFSRLNACRTFFKYRSCNVFSSQSEDVRNLFRLLWSCCVTDAATMLLTLLCCDVIRPPIYSRKWANWGFVKHFFAKLITLSRISIFGSICFIFVSPIHMKQVLPFYLFSLKGQPQEFRL